MPSTSVAHGAFLTVPTRTMTWLPTRVSSIALHGTVSATQSGLQASRLRRLQKLQVAACSANWATTMPTLFQRVSISSTPMVHLIRMPSCATTTHLLMHCSSRHSVRNTPSLHRVATTAPTSICQQAILTTSRTLSVLHTSAIQCVPMSAHS